MIKKNIFPWMKKHKIAISPETRKFVGSTNKKGGALSKRPKDKKSTGGRKAPSIQKAVSEEAVRIRKEYPAKTMVQVIRSRSIVKLLKPNALHTDLRDIDDKEYKNRTGKSARTVLRWISPKK